MLIALITYIIANYIDITIFKFNVSKIYLYAMKNLNVISIYFYNDFINIQYRSVLLPRQKNNVSYVIR